LSGIDPEVAEAALIISRNMRRRQQCRQAALSKAWHLLFLAGRDGDQTAAKAARELLEAFPEFFSNTRRSNHESVRDH